MGNRPTPAYLHVLLRAMILGLVIWGPLVLYGWYSGFKAPRFDFDQKHWTLAGSSFLRYDGSAERDPATRQPKAYTRHRINLKAGDQVTPVAHRYNWVQVWCARGNKGFVLRDELSQAARTEVGHLPYINSRYVHPTTYEALLRRVSGKTIGDAEKRYGPASSIISNKAGGKDIFFRHLDVTKDSARYRGAFLIAGADGRIADIELGRSINFSLGDRMPLAHFIRSHDYFGLTGQSFYSPTDASVLERIDGLLGSFKRLHWSTRIIGWIVHIVIYFILFFLVLSLPRLVAAPLIMLVSHATWFSNGFVIMINTLIMAFLFYVFSILITVTDTYWIPAILLLLVLSFWVHTHAGRVAYHRCPACHSMHSAAGMGSTFLGTSKHVTWGTYDVYKGKTETETTITRHFERRDQKTTAHYDEYDDHRSCTKCGHRWDVKRHVKTGEETTRY